MNIETVETPELGNRSYVVDDGRRAIVVDPQRDLDRVQAVLERRGVDVAYVVETHIHNDYVSGGLELARRCGATYVVNAADDVAFDRHPVRDGDALEVASLRLRAVSTPGHTDTHLSYVVEQDGAAAALFTGGSLLYGTVGRTDLVDATRAREFAAAQYRSARRLAAWPATSTVHPTHGFGSFCSGGSATGTSDGTLAAELSGNPVFTTASVADFADRLVESLGAYPTYYTHMAALNRSGAGAFDPSAAGAALTAAEVAGRLAAGEAVVDLRNRTAYAAAHLAGTLSITFGNQLATYLGWLVPFGARVTLLSDDPDEVRAARRQLALIGYDTVDHALGPAVFAPADRGFARRTFGDLAAGHAHDAVVLDVRRAEERHQVVPGSVHIPLHELDRRAGELPHRPVWVHCVSGFRAGIAASILEQKGYDVVQIDDHIDNAHRLGTVAA